MTTSDLLRESLRNRSLEDISPDDEADLAPEEEEEPDEEEEDEDADEDELDDDELELELELEEDSEVLEESVVRFFVAIFRRRGCRSFSSAYME